jgi:hypothetical protein
VDKESYKKANTKFNMQKSHSPSNTSVLEKRNLSDAFEESWVMEWMTKHGRKLAYALIGLFVLLFFVYRMSASHHAKSEADYLSAFRDFAALERESAANNQPAAEDTLERMQLILQRHPELHAQYDGSLAQILINEGKIAEAMPFADATFLRMRKEGLPYYVDYAKTTLLISEQKYQEALTLAMQLKQSMLRDAASKEQHPEQRTFGSLLFAFNLLRIATLQQQLGNSEGELAAWEEWKQFAEGGATSPSSLIDSKAFNIVSNHLAKGKVSLLNYIDHRQKTLKR